MKLLVDNRYAKSSIPVALDKELLHHWNCVKSFYKGVHGRAEISHDIQGYIAESTSDQPFLLHGTSGSGKTSLIAKVAEELIARVDSRFSSSHVHVLVRFCGTSGTSSDADTCVRSLCSQVDVLDGRQGEACSQRFREWLEEGREHLTVVLIDSPESMYTDLRHVDWLPSSLGKNVKVVFAVNSSHWMFEQLLLRLPPSNVLELPELRRDTLISLASVAEKVIGSGGPGMNALAARLIFHMSLEKHQKAYMRQKDHPHEQELSADFMDWLEAKHGPPLVEYVLGLLSVAPRGLSDLEITDTLSLADSLLEQVFLTSEPEVRRFPATLWINLRADLDPYITRAMFDDISVYVWRHASMRESVRARYAPEDAQQKFHIILSDFYAGHWAGDKFKPYKRSEEIMKAFSALTQDVARPRYATMQPLTFKDDATKVVRYNGRKLRLWPTHLARSKKNEALRTTMGYNLEWISAQLAYGGHERIMADLYEVGRVSLGKEDKDQAKLVRQALRDVNPDDVAFRLSGALTEYYKTYPRIRGLIKNCDDACANSNGLVPITQLYLSCSSPLISVLTPCSTDSLSIMWAMHDSEEFLLRKPKYKATAQVWSVARQQEVPERNFLAGSSLHASSSDMGIVYSVRSQGEVVVMDARGGRIITRAKIRYGPVIGHAHGHDTAVILYDKGDEDYEKRRALVVNLTTSEQTFLDVESSCVAISKHTPLLALHSGPCIMMYHLPSLDTARVYTLNKDQPRSFRFLTPQHLYVHTMNNDMLEVRTARRETEAECVINRTDMCEYTISHDLQNLLIVCEKILILIRVDKHEICRSISRMPKGFSNAVVPFQDASFTFDDSKVVGLRAQCLLFWDAELLSPLYLLHLDKPVLPRIHVSDTRDAVATLSKEGDTQVWSVERALPFQTRSHESRQVDRLCVSENGRKIIFMELKDIKMTVLDTHDMSMNFIDLSGAFDVTEKREHLDLCLSPSGRIAIVTINAKYNAFDLDRLWNAGELPTNKVTFYRDDHKLAIIHGLSTLDLYPIREQGLSDQPISIQLSPCYLIAPAVTTACCRYLLFITRPAEGGDVRKIYCFFDNMMPGRDRAKGLREIDYNDWVEKDARPVQLAALADDHVLLMFNRPHQGKSAAIFKADNGRVLKKLQPFIDFTASIKFSSNGQYLIDAQGRFFTTRELRMTAKFDTERMRDVFLVYEGQRLVVREGGSIIVYDTGSHAQLASLDLDAERLIVADDGRLVCVLTRDGRLALLHTFLTVKPGEGVSELIPSKRIAPPSVARRESRISSLAQPRRGSVAPIEGRRGSIVNGDVRRGSTVDGRRNSLLPPQIPDGRRGSIVHQGDSNRGSIAQPGAAAGPRGSISPEGQEQVPMASPPESALTKLRGAVQTIKVVNVGMDAGKGKKSRACVVQ